MIIFWNCFLKPITFLFNLAVIILQVLYNHFTFLYLIKKSNFKLVFLKYFLKLNYSLIVLKNFQFFKMQFIDSLFIKNNLIINSSFKKNIINYQFINFMKNFFNQQSFRHYKC